MQRRIAVVAGLAAVALCIPMAACSSGGGGDTGSTDGTGAAKDASEVEVFTWWSSGSEELGLKALTEVFTQQHPDTKFVNGAVAGGGGSQAKDLLQTRLQTNDPPDTFQAHAGKEIQDYIDAGQVEDVSYLYDEFKLRDAFPKDLIDLLTADGKIYSVPSNIHRANVIWASVDVLKNAGLDATAEFKTMDDFLAALEQVKTKTPDVTPLSIGMAWTQVHMLETVLIADLGPDAYRGLWDGSTDWKSAEVTKALGDFEKLMSYTNKDRDNLDWSEATQMLIDDKAAFNIMGDWAPALFDSTNQVAGTDYVYAPAPGTIGIFDFLADSFTLPVGAKHVGGTENWLNTISTVEGQTAFNKVKGSIPARTDANPSDFSEYQQTAIKSFAEDTIVPSLAHGAASTIKQLASISDATSKFTSGGSDLATFQTELSTAMTS